MTDVYDIIGSASKYERDDAVVILDSALRDTSRYPNPSNYAVDLDEPLSLVHGIDVLDAAIPASFYNVNATNNSLTVMLLTQDIAKEYRQLLAASDFQALVDDNTRVRVSFIKESNTYHRDIAIVFDKGTNSNDSVDAIIAREIDPSVFVSERPATALPGLKLFDADVMHVFIARETTYSTIRTEHFNHQLAGLRGVYIHFGDDSNYIPPSGPVGVGVNRNLNGIVVNVRARKVTWLEAYHVPYNRPAAIASPLGSRSHTSRTTIFASVLDLLMPPGFYSADTFVAMLPRATRDVLNASFDSPDGFNPSFPSVPIGNLSSKLTFYRGTGNGSENTGDGSYAPGSESSFAGGAIRGSPFAICQRKSSISSMIGMNYVPFLFASYDTGTGIYSATPSGVAAFNEMPYVVFRCEEIEEHMYRHGVHGRAGLGMVKLVAPNALNMARINFVNFVRRPFHPVTIRRLTIRLEDSKGNLFDFNGGNNVITLRISMYTISRKTATVEKHRSVINPDYDSDVVAYLNSRQVAEEELAEYSSADSSSSKADDIDALVKEHNRRAKAISSELMHALLDVPP